MGIFADPRAFGLTPADEDESQEMRLLDSDLRVLATAIRYSSRWREWWGVCSHRSGIPIDKRASSVEEARLLLMQTVWMAKIGVEQDEFASHSESAKAGALYIRSLTSAEVLEAARDEKSRAWKRIAKWMGEGTNPDWITARCAEVAYARGVMDAQEMDWICR